MRVPGPDKVASYGRAREQSELLELLADALLGQVEGLLAKRIEALTAEAAPPQGERWLRVSEVAERVGACERTVYRALRSGRLAGERLGAQWRIRPEAVAAWLAASSDPPPAPARPARGPTAPGRRAAEATSYRTRARAGTRPQGAGGPSPTTGGDRPQERK